MLPTTIRTPPSPEDYTPLDEFQSKTPETFIGGKPVLHFHLVNVKASIPSSQCGSLSIFPKDTVPSAANGDGEQQVEQDVDIFVGSDHFTIFSQESEAGVSIPYPSISIHAVKQINNNPALWMQLEFSDGGAGDDDFNAVELTLIPSPQAAEDNATTPNVAKQLYEAIANCSNLHPDPHGDDDEEDEEDDYDNNDRIIFEGSAEHETLEGFTGVLRGAVDGSLPPPMPGSGGWITAENVHEFFDEDGNWVGGKEQEQEQLGDGAGRIRGHDEVDDDHADKKEDETKRARTD